MSIQVHGKLLHLLEGSMVSMTDTSPTGNNDEHGQHDAPDAQGTDQGVNEPAGDGATSEAGATEQIPDAAFGSAALTNAAGETESYDRPYGEQPTAQYGQFGDGARRDQAGPQGYGSAASPYGQQVTPYGQQPTEPVARPDRPKYGEYAPQRAGFAAPANGMQQIGGPGEGDAGAGGGAAFGAAAATAAPDANRRRIALPLIGVAVIAAVVGGLVGAGWVSASGTGSSSTAQQGGNLTVNDYNSASVVTAVAAKATPSVVTIDVTASSEEGTGSGVVLDKSGYIVTNTHVVTLDGDSSSGTIKVTTSNGKIYSGKLVGTDPTVDLAVVKIDASDLTPISFANSAKLNVGDTAVAIGAPLGLSNTVTDGIVSTLNRSIQVTSSAPDSSGDSNEGNGNGDSGPYDFWGNGDNGSTSTKSTVSLPVIQTDAAINPGNSGGALLDSKGRLIGINVAIASASSSSSSSSSSSGSIGVGFSIPANLAKRVSSEIISDGSASHGLLGASVYDSTDSSSSTQLGAVIKSTTAGGAAASAGLKKGDLVTRFGGIAITSATDLTAQVRYLAGGAKSTITFIRNGTEHTADVTLGTYKSDS